MNIVHLTSAHPRNDIRVFKKECVSLARQGFNVSLLVADGNGRENRENIEIIDVGVPKSRIDRIRNAPKKIYREALELDADVFHLHDPELLPIALKLKKRGKIVIFDAHEDVPKQILGKPYLNRLLKSILSRAFSIYERSICTKLDVIIAATPSIRDKFLNLGARSITVNNYPLMGELSKDDIVWSEKRQHVGYVGGISRIRGILQVVDAMGLVCSGARLQLAGQFGQAQLEHEARLHKGWQRVDSLGHLDRKGVRDLLGECVGGVVTFLPSPNHIYAQPNKMFEYMSAGVPVIGSHFPLWREIIEGNQCGICVDPLNPGEIAGAIDYLVTHPAEAEQMGRNGQRAVLECYNWNNEERKLLDLYNSLDK